MFTFMAIVFVLGYIAIIIEHNIHVDKAASALLTAVLVWTLLMFGADAIFAEHASDAVAHGAGHGSHGGGMSSLVSGELRHHLGEIAEILFFLMGAMTIVELIDAHDGFKVITDKITTTSKVTLMWVVCSLAFILSAIIDNLATTIVMISLLSKLIADKELRWTFVGMVVVSANAGGAWSPIGDVTTTMLWIGGQVTAANIIKDVFLPSLVCMIVPLGILSMTMKGTFVRPETIKEANHVVLPEKERNFILGLGICLLLMVPIFKSITHLPPYMGMLLGLSILWIVTEIMHGDKDYEHRAELTVVSVMRKLDMASILFFLGILLAVGALASAGHLNLVATYLRDSLGDIYSINIAIGLLSALVDNVPLVAGAMKMYPLATPEMLANATDPAWTSAFVVDGEFWKFLAYCAGTGGSCIIMGSAAGVAAMGLEKISFMWYMKKISWLALIGYLAGAFTYIAIH